MCATTTCCIHVPMIYIFYSLNSDFFFQLANRAGKRNNHFIMHKNFNIGYFFFVHDFSSVKVNERQYCTKSPQEDPLLRQKIYSVWKNQKNSHQDQDCSCEMTRTAAPFKRKIAFRTITSQNHSQNAFSFLCHAPTGESRPLVHHLKGRMRASGGPQQAAQFFFKKGRTPPA